MVILTADTPGAPIQLQPKPVDEFASEKAQCRADGGTWDSGNNVCILPKPEPQFTLPTGETNIPEPEQIQLQSPVNQGTVQTGGYGEVIPQQQITNPELLLEGQAIQQPQTGVNKPQVGKEIIFNKDGTVTFTRAGKTITTSKEEYELAEGIGDRGGMITEDVQGIRATSPEAIKQRQLQQSIGQVGQIGQLSPQQQAEVNWSQALTAGTVGQIPSILKTAGGFAATGLVSSGFNPLVAAGAGVVGVIAGITSGVLGNIKEQQRGELRAAKQELTDARTAMRQLAMLASQDPANSDQYIQLYNDTLTRVYQARQQTKLETQGDLNAFMEDGREQLAQFDSFLSAGGLADIYGEKLRVALSSGQPLTLDNFSNEELAGLGL